MNEFTTNAVVAVLLDLQRGEREEMPGDSGTTCTTLISLPNPALVAGNGGLSLGTANVRLQHKIGIYSSVCWLRVMTHGERGATEPQGPRCLKEDREPLQ